MNQMSSVKRACITAVCIALCYVLPLAFHAIGAGSVFSPMHIPVLLCGMICGGFYGAVCGIAGPVLSSVLSGMPSTTALMFMGPELMAYGLITGLLMQFIRTKNLFADLYISMVGAMVLGRVVGGIASAIFYLGNGGTFSIAAWATSYFVGSAPGIICHLIVVPVLVFALMKARLIPARYPKTPAQEP